ncbi:neutral zinc metallopeptidase [Tessaracoccus sp. OS52]|uniref:KPN_02809 family neutral zinc metallopeptidase n=1 Tax=Tessaracoccus sp. OS52 TaxID=2886691 RepID=UPI00351CF38C
MVAVEYRGDARIDQSRVRYGGGGGRSGGRGMAVGGGLGGIVMIVLVLLFGGNLGDVLGGTGMPDTQPQQTQPAPECDEGSDIETNRDCRWPAYENAVQNYWSSVMQGYEYGSMMLFSGQVQTACGTGSSEMGPFYCPGDYTVYIDTDFMGTLLDQLGAVGGDAAELYIVGHEFGHHVSNLTGQMEQARAGGQDTGPTSNQVRLELQADCYAGVFFNNTLKDPESPIESVTRDDLLRIADAARAVGDDHIQQQQGGRVVPESWTHGSSEQRQRWVAKGYDSGDPNACDTFATNDL